MGLAHHISRSGRIVTVRYPLLNEIMYARNLTASFVSGPSVCSFARKLELLGQPEVVGRMHDPSSFPVIDWVAVFENFVPVATERSEDPREEILPERHAPKIVFYKPGPNE
ncbi:MAG: hypothetical protein ACRD28_13075 [Acidobacteriaceae bacterium]